MRPMSLLATLLSTGSALFTDDSGQDLIEYGLLTGIIGITTVLVCFSFAGKMEDAYGAWDTGAQDVWEPCDPISLGGACP